MTDQVTGLRHALMDVLGLLFPKNQLMSMKF
jgi:hypothetical protein